MVSGKAPGVDGLPAEVFKAGGLNLITKQTHLFQNIWNLEQTVGPTGI